ncbi:hypothetical protein AAC387_Pa04g1423 [Persea americana]
MRQRLIALKDEEYYKIMVSNHPWVTDDESIMPKPTFFFGDAVLDDSTYQRRCFQFSFTVGGQKRTVSARSTFDRTISIMSLSSTCSKREDPPSWVKRTSVIKTGVFAGGPSGFVEKSPTRMDIVMPASSYQGSDHPSVDLRPVGLGIFKGDGSNWVKPFRLRGRFSADSSWESWTDHILQVGGVILKEAEIFYARHHWAPILGNLYEELMHIDCVLEEQSEEFRLLYFQLVAFYDFLKEKEGSKVRCSSWRSGSSLSSNFFDSGEPYESTTQEARAKNPDPKKISAMRENLKEFFVDTDAIHFDIALWRDLAVYLTYWLGEAVFAGGNGTHIKPYCIFPACQMAFGERLALVPALYSYLCTKLQAAAFLGRLGLPMNRVFLAHIFYSWYVYHCPSFHRLGAPQDDDPFMIRLARGKPVSEYLLSARLRIRRFWDVEMGQSSVKLSPGLRKKAFDFGVSRDSTKAGSGRHYSLTNAERSWLLNLGFSQGVIGAPSSNVKRFGGLQDGRNAWAFYSAEDTTAMIPYPELPTFGTAGFTKWFVESLSVYRGLSKKELDGKQSSGKGLGKSDGVRREEVMAFLFGEKHITGFVEDQDIIRSRAAQEIPGEVLEQPAEEEAEVAAWIQTERAKASMESTGKNRPSNEDSGERPNFYGGAGTSSNSSHRSKRRRGQRRSQRRHGNSPDLEIPSTIAEEASGDDDEPLEKRSRGGKISSDEDDDLMVPEVPADEGVTDPISASEEEPGDSEVDPKSPPANLPEDSDDFEPSMDVTFDDALDKLMEAESIPPVVEEGCEVTEEVPLSFLEPEQGMPVTDPGVGVSSTSFDEAEASLPADIPSPAALIGKSFLITLPTVPNMDSRPTRHGESSSESSRQFAMKVLKRVLSSWVETLSSGHLEAGFGMVKHVHDILADSEEVGLDITDAKAFVNEVITLGNKWNETKSFPNDDFFNEMFFKPSSEVKSELNEISRTRKQLIRERNVTKLAIIELIQDQHRIDREVTEARQHLELLEE